MTRQIYVFFFGWPSERLTCSNQTQNRFFLMPGNLKEIGILVYTLPTQQNVCFISI